MAVTVDRTQPRFPRDFIDGWGHDPPKVSLEQLMASLSICPKPEIRTRKAGSPVRRDYASQSFLQARITKLNTRSRKKSSKPKRPKSARMQIKDLPSNMQFPVSFDVFSFRSSPDLSARWMQLAARVRMSEVPEGSKQQPTTVFRPSFATSIKDSRRRTKKRAAYVAGPGTGVGTGIFESSPRPSNQRLALKQFGLLALPRELREVIYSFVVQPSPRSNTSTGKMHLSLEHRREDSSASTLIPKISRLTYAAFALLSASKQIRTAALPLLYRLNTFYARAIKSLPTLLELPHAPANLLTLDLSFTSLKHKENLFTSINALTTLPQLRTLNLTFDVATLLALSNACLTAHYPDKPFEICTHHPLTDPTVRNEHSNLVLSGSRPRRCEVRKLRLLFRHASTIAALRPQRPKKGEAPEARVVDCLPCAILRGFREIQRLAEEAGKKAQEAQQALINFQPGDSVTFPAQSKGRNEAGGGKTTVPTVVVLRTKGADAAEEAEAEQPPSKTAKGLWPILAPEPSACTDWKGACPCGRFSMCRH